jgi:hypothetical protein
MQVVNGKEGRDDPYLYPKERGFCYVNFMSNLSIEFIPRNSPRRGASGLPSHDLGEHLILDAEDDSRFDPWVVLHPWSGGSSLPLN